ncbi:MAG: large conductance mechanosensitive channel protein MscL [Clostridia bacterium]|nr:large conductance mechanosensitive channel protein MscL [Clostridia bacterium]
MFKKWKEKRKDKKGLMKEFAEFINRGSIIDMAVGVIVGAAFKDIVNRLVDSIVMPILGLIIKTDLTELKTPVEQADGTVVEILWGTFIQACLDFLIIAAVIFAAIKIFSMIRKALAKAKEVVENAVDNVVDMVKGDDEEEKAPEVVAEEAQNEEK